MNRYSIQIIINDKIRPRFDCLRSNVEAAALMRELAHIASKHHGEETIYAILRRGEKIISAFDWESGKCCGQLSISEELLAHVD